MKQISLLNLLLIFAIVALAISLAMSRASSARLTSELDAFKKHSLRFEDSILYLYDGAYGFDPGDGEIASINTDYRRDENGAFQSASIVVPSGAVLIAVREHYTLGSYTGKIAVERTDGKIESLDKIFFVVYSDGRPIKYSYPSVDKQYERFAGKPIDGVVTFY